MLGKEWGDCVIDGVATLSCIFPLFQNVITALIILSGTAAVFLIMLAGYKFVRSAGDPKKVEEARLTALYAVLGIFLIMLSFMIVNIIAYITNADCITKFGFDQCDPDAIVESTEPVTP